MAGIKIEKLHKELLKAGEKVQAEMLFTIYNNHRGKENAIKRERLLSFCHIFEPDISDREMRRL